MAFLDQKVAPSLHFRNILRAARRSGRVALSIPAHPAQTGGLMLIGWLISLTLVTIRTSP